MKYIVLDHIDGICLEPSEINHYRNELAVLQAWHHGLHFLYQQMRAMEETTLAKMASQIAGTDENQPLRTKCVFANLSCCFQWYAVTLCNFVELVGCIGWELDKSRSAPRKYVGDVIPVVLAYRNNVAAHVSRARQSNTAAERFASLFPPSTLINGRYHGGVWRVTKGQSGTVSNSGEIQPWSLTNLHEELAQRFWPQMVAATDTGQTVRTC